MTAQGRTRNGIGKASGRVVEAIRAEVTSGSLAAGDYLPSVRTLCSRHEVSIDTVMRALRALEGSGEVAGEGRRGYRVLTRPAALDSGRPVGYLLNLERGAAGWTGLYQLLMSALQQAGAKRGWPLVGIGTAGMSPREAVEQACGANAWGLIVTDHKPDIVRAAQEAGLPVVMADGWRPGLAVDAIVQDGFAGGFLAAQHLIDRGHRDILWLGRITNSIHSETRWGGASAACMEAGAELVFDETTIFRGEIGVDAFAAAIRKLLSHRKRPKAVLGLWRTMCLGVISACREFDLKIGRDLDLVGWCPEEQYDREFLPHCNGSPVPPVISWSIARMAEATLDRLAERRANPNMPAIRINIGTTLKLGTGEA
ncbi:MAG: substrate-binding domain-containing protein [Planctomycetota bacterium]|jgi:DNA-binding LacI/PurR family transcriptional regulator